MRTKILAAKILSCGLPLVISTATPAQISVIDITGLRQTTITAVNQVAQVRRQIQQYQTQLQQYRNMLQNTVAPTAYIWSEA